MLKIRDGRENLMLHERYGRNRIISENSTRLARSARLCMARWYAFPPFVNLAG
jgi:hypothetical protein